MFIVIAVQSVGLYLEWRPDPSRYDNDLKYRHVLMKGEASPKRLSQRDAAERTTQGQNELPQANLAQSPSGGFGLSLLNGKSGIKGKTQ